MHYRYVHYNLEHGFIHNWLIAGPQTIPVKIEQFPGDDVRKQIIQHYYEPESGITKTPVERGPLTKGLFQVGDYAGSWNYQACREDHLVDHGGTEHRSGVFPAPHYLRSWAYTQVFCKASQEVLLVLTTHGPADVWLNGQHVHRQEHFHVQQPGSVAFKVLLLEGANKITVRFENVALHECAHAMALQVCKLIEAQPINPLEPYPSKAGIHVRIPTLIEAISRRNTFERVCATAYIPQDVYEGDVQIRLHWPADLDETSYTTVRLQATSGQTYAEADVNGTPGDQVFLGFPYQIPEGSHRIVMMPRPWEVYERNTRITREIPLWSLGRTRYSASPYGTYEERRQEALASATQRTGLFAEIAKMALNQWKTIKPEDILQTAKKTTPVDLVGLLGMMYRYGDHAMFPQELAQPVEECILNYQYRDSEVSGLEPVHWESQLILSHACEILAGQRYPERTFRCSGKSGQWHRENGERLALVWLQQRGATGFNDWDSNSSFAEILAALSYLIDLADTESIWEMAAVVIDKLFFTIAVNSYQGVFGSTHGRTYASYVKGGLLEPTSGIARLMWGIGIFNHHVAAPVSLACMEKYELPSIISDIAVSADAPSSGLPADAPNSGLPADAPNSGLPTAEEMWSRERHAVNAERVVNKVTYKTPDSMLGSAQDYYPGEKGCQEHIWQATLGAAATVFVTHPACTSEDDARRPSFWAGNATLPRVAQWKDMLIAVYHLPDDDWMGFTHAYFPTYAFDEYILRAGWAFARKGNGYLALTCAQGFSLTQQGHYAFRELRSYGLRNTWLCHMGRAALDGNFTTFQDKVLALAVKLEEQSVHCTTLRGEALSFGWQAPFLRDGQEQPLSGFMHYENPYTVSEYPCTKMDIQLGEDILRLDFGSAVG